MAILRGKANRQIKNKIGSDASAPISTDEFQEIVNYERIRSDRFGGTFSVVNVNCASRETPFLESFARELLKNKRSVDFVGWGRPGMISVLLPDTGFEGSQRFCQKVSEGIFSMKPPVFEVYSYPDHWIQNWMPPTAAETQSVHVLEVKSGTERMFIKKMSTWKRLMDIIFAGLGLILCLPVFIIVAVFIKVVSPGPIFFSQPRIGYKGVPFLFWKFRTMKPDNDQKLHGKHSQEFINNGDIPMQKLDSYDPRIIPGGRFLRASCIDEMPQLWNVLNGSMSLVGPRPCIPYEAEQYLRWNTHRFDTVPGMTGLWQVSGKNKLTFKQMIRLDISYCKNITFLRDLSILLRTPLTIIHLLIDSGRNITKTKETDNEKSLLGEEQSPPVPGR